MVGVGCVEHFGRKSGRETLLSDVCVATFPITSTVYVGKSCIFNILMSLKTLSIHIMK